MNKLPDFRKISQAPSISELESLRQIMDPLADRTILEVEEKIGVEKTNKILQTLIQNEALTTLDMPDTLKFYLEESSKFPSFTNPELIQRAEKFFAIYGPEISMMLLTKSLPASYACKKGAEVLYRTGRLLEDSSGGISKFTRRLMETSQFVINLLQKGGMGAEGSGLRSAQKVRLMHASIRYYLQKKQWDSEAYDMPINQEDMLGTLMDFAVYPIEGMEQIGIEVLPEDREAYYHVWRIAGHWMGVLPELIPETYDGGSILGHAILKHQQAPSEAGIELTKACLHFLEHITPGSLFDFYPKVIVRYLIGDELADMLEIKKYDNLAVRITSRILTDVIDHVEDKKDEPSLIRYFARKFNRSLLQGMVNWFNQEKNVSFRIPPDLKDNWLEPLREVKWVPVAATPAVMKYRISIEKKVS